LLLGDLFGVIGSEFSQKPATAAIALLIATGGWIPMSGTKLADVPPADPIEFVRIIALARILMPQSHVRLTAGRTRMTDEMQALCFFAGANSIFVGDTLLTAANPGDDRDSSLLRRLGLTSEALENPH
jgi:biotin synthase